jgi:hypothetical protein
MAQINMAQRPESGLDALAKALNVAQSIYGISSDMSRLNMAKEAQAKQLEAEQRAKEGFLTSKEALEYGKDYTISDQAAPGAFQRKIQEGDQVREIYLSPKTQAADNKYALSQKDVVELTGAGGRLVPPGTKGAQTIAAVGADGKVYQTGLIPPKKELSSSKDSSLKDQNRRLPPDKVLAVNEGNQIPDLLQDIRGSIDKNSGLFGPVAGRIAGMNPYDERAATLDAQLRAGSQAFGRYMEGGVLRKEDEDKYRKMFPNLSDTKEIAANKLAIVERLLAKKQNSNIEALSASGYDVGGVGRGGLSVPDVPNVLRRGSPPAAAIPSANASNGPKAGVIEDGHRFLGGNPADPKNWERVK